MQSVVIKKTVLVTTIDNKTLMDIMKKFHENLNRGNLLFNN